MAVKKITASIAYQDLFEVPEHKVGVIDGLIMVNRTNSSVMVTLEDHFTPDASAGVASPSAVSQEVARIQHAVGTFSYTGR